MARVSLAALRSSFPLYAERVLKIVDKNANLVPFRLNWAQLEVLRSIALAVKRGRPPRLVILKARQLGFSTLMQGLLFWKAHLTRYRQSLVLAHKVESAEKLFQKSKLFYDNLPDPLRYKKKYSTKRMIHFDCDLAEPPKPIESVMQVEVAGEVRGYTALDVHLSELAFYEDPVTVMTAILQTVPMTTDSMVAVESTPNGWGNYFHTLYLNAKGGKSDFIPLFFPWFSEPTYRMTAEFYERDLGEDERELMGKYALTLEQLAWRRYKIDTDFNGDLEKFQQEYPSDDVSCFLMSGRPVFEARAIRNYFDSTPPEAEYDDTYPPSEIEPGEAQDESSKPLIKKPVIHAPIRRGRLRLYEPPIRRHRYVWGWDIAQGDPGSDPTAGCCVDQHTLNVVATWHGRTPPEVAARYAAMLGWHYNEALLVAEANNHGLLFLHELKNLYDHLYYRTTSPDSVAGKVTDKLGYWTSVKTREHLINTGRAYVRKELGRIHDRVLLAEAASMIYAENERADHPEGGHDDMVFAFCLSLEGHKGDPDAALTPIPMKELESVFRVVHHNRALGLPIDDVLRTHSMTCEELEQHDEREHKRELRRERQGLGGQA